MNTWRTWATAGLASGLLLPMTSARPERESPPPERPNFLVILADDMGFSDIGCYGSEIRTPHLDALAARGVKFTQFYNAARCCPSRAALLTGVYPHRAGMGGMVTKTPDHARETPYQGWLSRQTPTLAERLRAVGYQTFLSGKWHVGDERPDWPLQRGFDQYFGLISGANSYYELLPGRTMLEGNEPYRIPPDFYMTDAITDKALAYLGQNRTSGKPFFLYVAYTAPHWPLHAPAADVERYKAVYRRGWDALRRERFARQQRLGLLPKTTRLSEREPDVPAWEKTTNQDEWAAKMAAYAAMVSRMDEGVGRLVGHLRATGRLDNTVIIFLSDNGACHEVIEKRAQRDLGETAYAVARVRQPGEKGSYTSYGREWATLGNTPFRLYKSFIHEGGIATPLIVHAPRIIRQPLQTSQVGHVMDLFPTCLELAGVNPAAPPPGQPAKPLDGRSLVPVLSGKTRTPHPFLAWEHRGNRGLREGDWKLVWSKRVGKWELYRLDQDRAERHDLSARYPAVQKRLLARYAAWADRVGVTDADEPDND